MRILLGIVVVLLLLAGGAYLYAGRMPGPTIEIGKPEKFVGVSTPLDVAVGAPGGRLSSLSIALEQNGKQVPLYTHGQEGQAQVKQDGPDTLRITRDVGKQAIPELQPGAARFVVTASRTVMYGLRDVSTTAAKDVQVRFERPRVAVISLHHFINHGGSELVVYRVTPPDVQSGVVVGDLEYPGFPASNLGVEGVTISDPAIRVAFFALRWDQDLKTPIRLFARDEAGNTGRGEFDYRVFPKPFGRGRIEVNAQLLDQVVPAILEGTTEVKTTGDPLQDFVLVNSELRRKNVEKIASFAKDTVPEMLWRGVVFHPFTNTGVQSPFAHHRTYFYKGKEVDQQVHLGFDLASYANDPIVAANRGRVLFADELGIFGNTVIMDHGLGLQSLYAHLSSFDVKAGDTVEKGQQLGRSGRTGMALGDHLHFTMLVNGHMVTPVEWWDAHWIEDRILRKLRAAGGAGS